MSVIRVLVDLQKIPGVNGAGEIGLTFKCAKPIRAPIPDIETYFESEKIPYSNDEQGEELMQLYLQQLRKV